MSMAIRSFMPATKLSFRRRTVTAAADNSPDDLSIPTHFKCPISLDLMKDPVALATGITYDRHSIETWLDAGNCNCPVTKQPLFALTGEADLIPNHSLRRMIQDWCVAHRALGVERIPTPKTPITALRVAETLSDIAAAGRRSDRTRFEELAAKLKSWSAESERNHRCISSNGAARVLAAAFRDIPSEQVLSAIAGMSPLGQEARRQLASVESLKSIVYILRNGNLSGRFHAVLVVKEIAAADTVEAAIISRTEGLVEAIVRLIKEPISPQATKTSLIAAYYLASSNQRAASKFAEMGIVTVLLEMLVDAERSLCEKGLAVLEAIFSSEAGREMAVRHELTVPVLVNKMLKVSDMATELAVSATWKLCRKRVKGGKGEGEKCLKEAVQFGAFQKLLLLLQVGCSNSTKEKVSELLRMLNGFRGEMECIESEMIFVNKYIF